jgi:nicotinamidase-related amidase
MSAAAVLLIDLQQDFLNAESGRMRVDAAGAENVVATANAILAGTLLPAMPPIFIVTEFPKSARIANYFRGHAAVEGSDGARIDPRIKKPTDAPFFLKTTSSAFCNAGLATHLSQKGINELYILGVFAEACIQATVCDALRRGFKVRILPDGIASDSQRKRRLALRAMVSAGAVPWPDGVVWDR